MRAIPHWMLNVSRILDTYPSGAGFDEVETHSMMPAQSDVKLLGPAKQQVA